jgi:multidrug efflux pump subunit AcrA (membrane-fusion protein)
LSQAKQRQTTAKQREERIGKEILRVYEAHNSNGQREVERQRIARTRRRGTLPSDETIGEPDVRKGSNGLTSEVVMLMIHGRTIHVGKQLIDTAICWK